MPNTRLGQHLAHHTALVVLLLGAARRSSGSGTHVPVKEATAIMSDDELEDAFAAADKELASHSAMSAKIPPMFDGKTSWFAYEELIDEWCSLTTLEPKLQGPNLRNRLSGNALVFKPLLNNQQLSEPATGVKYFKDTLRPHFVKGNDHVFLWRFMKIFRMARGTSDITTYPARYQIAMKRLRDSWMDIYTPISPTDPEYLEDVQRKHEENIIKERAKYDEHVRNLPQGSQLPDFEPPELPDYTTKVHLDSYDYHVGRPHHESLFPIDDNMSALLFIASADLTEQQRERLMLNLSSKGIKIRQYNWLNVHEAFQELFFSTKTGFADPMLRHSGKSSGGHRSFLIIESSTHEGDYGYWVQDEQSGQEGFLSTTTEVFWSYNNGTGSWESANVAGRRLRAGKGKKGKGKGKKGKGKKGHQYGKGFYGDGNTNPDSQWHDEYWSDSYYGKAKGKGKKGKGKKGKPSYQKGKEGKGPEAPALAAQGNPQQEQPAATANTQPPASSQAALVADSWSYDDPYGYDSSWDYTWWTQPTYYAYDDWSWQEPDARAWIVTHINHQLDKYQVQEDVYLAGIGRWQKLDVRNHPTYVILDSGCTRCMGSRVSVEAFVAGCRSSGFKGWFQFVPTSTKFSFANSQTADVWEKMIIHFPTDPPCKTEIDILEQGNVPILISVQQMRNLNMSFRHTPDCDYITCAAFGLKDFPVPVSTSNHLLLDLADLKKAPEIVSDSFMAEDLDTVRTAVECPPTSSALAEALHYWSQQPSNTRDIDAETSKESSFLGALVPDAAHEGEAPAEDYAFAETQHGGSSSSSAPAPAVARPPVLGTPTGGGAPAVSQPSAPADAAELPVRRRLRKKTEDPVTAAALEKIHKKLRDKAELYKLHLKHYHMPIEQFKTRTSHLKIPDDIYKLYEEVIKQCPTCAANKNTPTRSRVSGMRAEVFGDLLFVDHGEVNIAGAMKFSFLIVLDGATNLVMAYPVEGTGEEHAQEALREFMHHMQVSPKRVVGDSAFQTPSWETFYGTHDITPIPIGPYTPWPNRAEASVRIYKKHVYQLVADLKNNPAKGRISVRVLLREACWARNVSCTYGGKTPIELAFGRRPPDIASLENSTPAQLTTKPLEADEIVNNLRKTALQSYLKARQADDLRNDLATSLRFSGGPYHVGDQVWYYQVDGSKIKNGKKLGNWIRCKVLAVNRSMVVIDLGTRVIQVNQSLIRKDYDLFEHIDVPLKPTDALASEQAQLVEDGSTDFAHALWQCCMNGKIDVLELFAGSARVSQCSALAGLRAGPPVDLRTGFDLNSRQGQKRAMKLILDQQPEVVFMAPLCAPWSQWSNMKDPDRRHSDRQAVMPMVRFVAQVAIHQLRIGKYFIIENPRDSAIWYVHCMADLLRLSGVTWDELHFCAYGMKDPVSNDYYNKPTCLMHNFPTGVLNPLFRKCPNIVQNKHVHNHEHVQGHAKGHGRRSTISQVYPYKFCTALAEMLRTFFNKRPQNQNVQLVYDILDTCFTDYEIKSLADAWHSEFHEEHSPDSAPVQSVPDVVDRAFLTASLTGIAVDDHYIKSLMSSANGLPRGCEIVLHQDATFLGAKLYWLTKRLRERYLPHLHFTKCCVLRGTLGKTTNILTQSDHSYVIFWRKNDPPKWVYIVQVQNNIHLLEKFDPHEWTLVHFWKEGSKTKIDPPPGLTQPQSLDTPMDQLPPTQQDTSTQQPPGQPPTLIFDTQHPSGHTMQPTAPVVDSSNQQLIPPSAISGGGNSGASGSHQLGGESSSQPSQPNPHQWDFDPTFPAEDRQPCRDIEKRLRNSTRDKEGKLRDKEGKRLKKSDFPGLPRMCGGCEKCGPNGYCPTNVYDEDVENDVDDDEEELIPDQPSQPSQPSQPPQSSQTPELNETDNSISTETFDTDRSSDHTQTFDTDRSDYEDLVVFEDQWSNLTEHHKVMAGTGSFTVCRDMYDQPIDIHEVHTFQRTLHTLYAQDRFSGTVKASRADIKEIMDFEDEDMAMIHLCFKSSGLSTDASATKVKKRKEATATDKRQFAKQFVEAKHTEYKSWIDNDVFDLVDFRTLSQKQKMNYVTGRWVLVIKRDKDGNFLKCKARWVLRGFQDRQKDQQQTDSPAASRPGFRVAAQVAANNGWDIMHMDLKTAFLQGESYDESRNVICQIPKEAGQPWYMVARMKKPAYGLNDAPRRWWNVVDSKLRSYECTPTRADRCSYVLYSERPRSTKPLGQSPSRPKPESQSSALDQALQYLLDPVAGNNSQGRSPCGIICLHVDDLFMVGDKEFHKRVVARLREDFSVGSEDTNDVVFVGQRVKWIGKPAQAGSYIRVDQNLAVDELHEVQFDKSLKDDVECTPALHTEYRSVLGSLNYLQSRTQYQACYKFSRCASRQSSPTIADVRQLNKLVRSVKAAPVALRFWPLKGPCRIIGFPDASYKNNEDKSSQRAMVVFLCEQRRTGSSASVDCRGSMIEYESHKITATTMSTTVAELYSLMKCFGTCLFLKGLWADMTGEVAELHLRTDANNLVTTARTTHQPEQKETIHLIQMLRKESNSGAIEDLAHVSSEDCLSDSLTKHSAKPDALIKAVDTGLLRNVDKHPPFRALLKHKAFMAMWVCNFITRPREVLTVLGESIYAEVEHALACRA